MILNSLQDSCVLILDELSASVGTMTFDVRYDLTDAG